MLLAARVGATLHLAHIFLPVPIATELGLIIPVPDEGYVRETRRSLEQVAAHLPGLTTAELLETDWYEGVDEALARYDPLLLVAGLTATHGPLDEWLSNRTLPLTTRTGYPLLLVPQALPDADLRLPLAVEDRHFELAHESFAVTPLLDALDLNVVTVTIFTPDNYAGAAMESTRSSTPVWRRPWQTAACIKSSVAGRPRASYKPWTSYRPTYWSCWTRATAGCTRPSVAALLRTCCAIRPCPYCCYPRQLPCSKPDT